MLKRDRDGASRLTESRARESCLAAGKILKG